MKIKVFEPNRDGKIEFTRAELEKLLNEVYTDGYKEGESDARSHTWTWTSPYLNYPSINGVGLRTTNADASIDKLTCDNTNNTNNTKNTATEVLSASAIEASNPITCTIQLSNNAENVDKIVNRVVSNIQNSVRDSVSIKGNDPFSKLAKELNF